MGGGGGGGPGMSPEKLKELEKVAKAELKKGAGSGKHNVFVSFASEDLGEVNLLRGQAKNENSDIEFNDWSLKKPFNSKESDYIKRGIRERIKQCSVTVVYISKETAKSKWVDWEIRESIALGKGVVAMHKGDAPPRELPSAIEENKVPVVSWNQRELAKAIERHAEKKQ